ncbi:LOW QUALITY PROTEIN: DUF1639 domain-containing protein [Cephalotus follicularis]|uniref:DUF1639 domain-containing protein n=1 Tax=Cephalotus follicularis TaxID=3775 RepID=A0A1Q3DC23_CEPFO|nr:LOW QUALITY PROTEIN: DUF1639 domain-containing protein [Cephalotus follicularis]
MEEKDQRTLESEFVLQWGNRKRLRCVRVKGPQISQRSNGGVRRRISSRFDRCVVSATKDSSPLQPNGLTRNFDAATLMNESRKSSSPEDRYYSTRGSLSVGVDDNGMGNNGEDKGLVWPKLYIALSSKAKEEDFMAMKGCKPSQRPKKRAKMIQRSLLLVSPGAWLTDMGQERGKRRILRR